MREQILPYQNPALSADERAADLLARLSLEEKMAQVVCFFPRQAADYDRLAKEHPQGVGGVSCLEMRALDTLQQAAEMQRKLQQRIMDLGPHRIPAIFHMEGLCGAYLQGAASFASGIGRGAAWDPTLEEQVGRVVGQQERAVGVTHTFAPVLDISRDPRMGRQGETYGEDPALTAALGAAFTRGLQAEPTAALRTEAVAKHFLGFHAGVGGIHGADCDISPRQLREVYAKPFQAAVTEGGLRGVMPCYNSLNGQPVSGNAELLSGLLREEMGFDGVVVSDYGAVGNIHSVQRVCESPAAAGLRAMSAGMDMELPGRDCFGEELAGRFADGTADLAVLDSAVQRVLATKFRMGLFEQPFALEGEMLKTVFAVPSARDISLRAARESLVLLKNDGVLPISPSMPKIAVIGCHAASARYLYGGYTHFSMAEGLLAAVSTMAGVQRDGNGQRVEMQTLPGTQVQQDNDPAFEALLKKQNPHAKSLLEQLRDSLPGTQVDYAHGYPVAGDDFSGHEEALATAKAAGLAVLTVGGKHGTGSIASMGEGVDATDIGLPPCQEVFIWRLATLGVPFVLVHLNGRPISSDVADRYANAILEAWNPAEAGAQAIVEALLGTYNPGGKLPVTVARAVGQIPVYYNHANGSAWHQGGSIGFADYVDMPHTPRYHFGHGLSYTSFEYGDLALDSREIAPSGALEVRLNVKNTGSLAGDEVVQLYLRDCHASMTRPVMELAGFARLHLAPGQERTVRFTLPASLTAFLDEDMRWKVEAGDFELLVGASSADIRLRESFIVTQDLFIEGRSRAFYAMVVTEE